MQTIFAETTLTDGMTNIRPMKGPLNDDAKTSAVVVRSAGKDTPKTGWKLEAAESSDKETE